MSYVMHMPMSMPMHGADAPYGAWVEPSAGFTTVFPAFHAPPDSYLPQHGQSYHAHAHGHGQSYGYAQGHGQAQSYGPPVRRGSVSSFSSGTTEEGGSGAASVATDGVWMPPSPSCSPMPSPVYGHCGYAHAYGPVYGQPTGCYYGPAPFPMPFPPPPTDMYGPEGSGADDEVEWVDGAAATVMQFPGPDGPDGPETCEGPEAPAGPPSAHHKPSSDAGAGADVVYVEAPWAPGNGYCRSEPVAMA